MKNRDNCYIKNANIFPQMLYSRKWFSLSLKDNLIDEIKWTVKLVVPKQSLYVCTNELK